MEKLIEIARSFSFKYNAKNYQSADFFCSQKAECKESEAEAVSEKLYQFCKQQVIKNLNEYIAENSKKETPEQEYVQFPAGGVTLPNGQGNFKKIYHAKETDSWRAEKDEQGNTIKVKINKDEETLKPN